MSRRAELVLLAAVLLVLLAAGLPADAADNAQGQGQGRVQPFVELQVSDGTISAFSATPSTSDPGPRAWSTSDGLTFNGRWTNTRHVVLLDVPSATDSSGASSQTVQGTRSTIADWVHLLQDDGTTFGTVQTTGTYDADAAAYTPRGGVTQDSQGSLTITTYGQNAPADHGTATTFYWIYDSGAGAYWFDTEKDLSDGDGETRVYPVSHKLRAHYVFSHGDLSYGVSAVGGAGGGYVPTVNLAWHRVPEAAGGYDFDVHALLDFPSGTPPDTYSYTVRGTIHSTK